MNSFDLRLLRLRAVGLGVLAVVVLTKVVLAFQPVVPPGGFEKSPPRRIVSSGPQSPPM